MSADSDLARPPCSARAVATPSAVGVLTAGGDRFTGRELVAPLRSEAMGRAAMAIRPPATGSAAK